MPTVGAMIAAPGGGPSMLLPLRYLVAAAGAFTLATLGVPWLAPELAGHYYQPRILALTHLVTLGWIALTIMGASYQIIPIILGRPIWSARLARWQFFFLAAGITGMVGHFFIAEWSGLLWGAVLVALGTAAHLVNAAMSIRGLRQWAFTARLVAGSLVGFTATVLFGLALLGWVLPMVIGVAARVYPVFLLAREPAGWPGRAQSWGVASPSECLQ